MRKFFTLLILSCLQVGLGYGQTATAPSGSGTSADPYQIASLENLYWLSQNSSYWSSSYYYEQTADIDASDTWDWSSGFSPIGNSSKNFKGSYDGKGYIIDSLYISRPSSNYIGFFGYTNGAKLNNINITNASITGYQYTGGLVGQCVQSNIYKCCISGSITGKYYIIGGLVGESVTLSQISNCYTNTNVTGTSYVGNLIGETQGGTITNCYCTGSNYGTYRTGGLIGEVSSATVKYCYTTAIKTGTSTNRCGVIFGELWYATAKNCFWDAETSGSSAGIGYNGYATATNITGKTTAEMQDHNTFIAAGWDFMNETANGSNNYWGINQNRNNGYPFLHFQGYTHNPPPVIDSVSNVNLSSASAYFRINELVTDIAHYGVCWNTSGSPKLTDNYTDEGISSTTGSYTSQITSLDTNKIYYIRAYTINANDTAYSKTISFESAYMPEITTMAVNNITDSTATGNLTFTRLGIPNPTAYGVCWNTSGSPTLSDSYSNGGNVSSAGTHSVPITGLTYNTTYYVQAFAVNEVDTVFGVETSFTALNAGFTASIENIAFGDTMVGISKQQIFYIKNTGYTVLNINSIDLPDAQFTIAPTSANITIGDSTAFTITFTPNTSGLLGGNVIFNSNAGKDTIEVSATSYYQRASSAGSAMDLDGSNNYINCGNNIDLANKSFSIDFWFKRGSINTNDYIIGLGDNYATDMAIHIGFRNTNYFTFAFYNDDINTDNTYTDLNWHHWAVTYDASTNLKRIYCDGIIAGSGTINNDFLNTESDDFWIGRGYDGNYADGQIDEVRVWDKSLTQDEIRAQYGPLEGNEEGLLAYWRFDEGVSGNYIYDVTGNGNTGILSNSPTWISTSTAPIAQPAYTFNPSNLNLGMVALNDSICDTVSIRNTGGGILHITSVNSDNSVFSGVTTSANIFSGDSAKFTVQFLPKAKKTETGNLTYNGNVSGTLPITGEGFKQVACTISSVTGLTDTSATINWDITSIGDTAATAHGICWGTDTLPTLANSFTDEGYTNTESDYSTTITDLVANTFYYVRPYSTSSNGFTSYGTTFSFTSGSLATISAISSNNVTDSSAIITVNISSLGIPDSTIYGICWNTTSTPTLNDSVIYAENKAKATGSYSIAMTKLSKDTTYYVRAFTSKDFGISYSDEFSFIANNAIFSTSVDTVRTTTSIYTAGTNSFYIANTGKGSLFINSAIAGDSKFTVSPQNTTIASGDSSMFVVSYYTASFGNDTTTIIFTSNSGSDTLAVIGTGTYQKSSNAENAIDLDGSNDYINCSSSFDFAKKSFSFDFWAKRGSSGTDDYVIAYGTGSSHKGLQIGFRSNNVFTFSFWNDDHNTTNTYTDNKWHHWACTYDASTNNLRIYCDGINKVNTTTSDDFNYSGTNPLTIGSSTFQTGKQFDGQIDEVRVWNKVLTQNEIRSHYGSLNGNEEGLIAYWRMDEGNDNYIFDLTGNGHTGTLMNSPTWVIPSTAPVAEPVFTAEPDTAMFGAVALNSTKQIDMKVKNAGGGILHIDNVFSDSTCFSVDATSANIFSGNSATFVTTYTPTIVANQSNHYVFENNMDNDTIVAIANGYASSAITTVAVIDTSKTTARISVNIDSIGSPNSGYGLCWNTTGTPTIADSYADYGAPIAKGLDTLIISSLAPTTQYYVRAYITNGSATSYGGELTLYTYGSPTVNTLNITNTTDSSANCNLKIVNLGNPQLTSYGACWNTTGMPTVADNLTSESTAVDTGYYATTLKSLTAGVTYYVRAYAMSVRDTAYGTEVSFMATNAVFNPSTDTIKLSAPITAASYDTLTLRNTGSSILNITSVLSNNNQFSIFPTTANVETGDSVKFVVSYTANSSSVNTTNLIFTSNAGIDTVVAIGSLSYQIASDASNAINFDGTNDYIDLGNKTTFNKLANGNFTIEMWINSTDNSTRSILIGNYYDGSPSYNIELTSSGYLRTFINGSSYYGTKNVADGKWHHIASVVDFDNDYVKIYIDGVENYSGSNTLSTYTVARNLMIGRDPRSSTFYYKGQIDEVRIWSKALTKDEIRSQYGSLKGNENGLVAYYRFDETNGNYAYDATGNGLSGTLKNSPSRVMPSTAPIAQPIFTANPTTLVYGNTAINDSSQLVLTVSNSGGGILHLDNVAFDSLYYSITPTSTNIFSGESAEFTAKFKPSKLGEMNAKLAFVNNVDNDTLLANGYGFANSFISTLAILDTTTNSMRVIVSVDSVGYPIPTAYGVCYSTSSTPTIANSIVDRGAVNVSLKDTITVSGLSPFTQYYVRAFITANNMTNYGDILGITTYSAPEITTINPSSIKDTSATGVVKVNNLGNPALTQYGVCWNTTGMPDLTDSHTTCGTLNTTGRYGTPMNGLSLVTTYFVRAYAINKIDTVYGAQKTFTTDKGTPEVEWNNPADITYGTILSNIQLNAKAYYNGTIVDGTYIYSPDIDSLLNAGNNTLSVAFTPTDASNYNTVNKTVSLTVSKTMLTVSANDTSRVYGNSDPVFRLNYTGFVNGENTSVIDMLPIGSTKTSATTDVGSYNIAVSGGNDNNYDFTYVGASMKITTRTLTLSGLIADHKIYDATTAATISGGTLEGTISGDDVSATMPNSGTFAKASVGSDIPVSVAEIVLNGSDAGNYAITLPSDLTADITAKGLTVSGLVASDKTYDATTTATISGGTLEGTISSDDVSATMPTSGTFAQTSIGYNIAVSVAEIVLNGIDAENYTLTQPSGLTADISAKKLTVSGLAASNKTYDATTAATISGGTLEGTISSDDVSATMPNSGTFAKASVGSDIPVSVAEIVLNGIDAENYTLTQPLLSADISARDLTITANNFNKTQGVDYTFANTEFTTSGLVSGESIASATITSDGATSSAKVGEYEILISNAIATSGTDLGNYTITYEKGTLSVVDRTELALTGLSANNKIYDGTTNATISNWGTLSGVVSGENVTLDYSNAQISFENKRIGEEKKVTVTGLVLSGTNAEKYFINSQTTTANITTRTINLSGFTADDKVYDGTTSVTGTGFSDDRIANDDITISYKAAFENKTVGNAKTVNYTDITINGTDAYNYNLDNTGGTASATILAKTLNVEGSFSVYDKEYDATTTAIINSNKLALSGAIPGDIVELFPVAEFATATIGQNITVSLTNSSTLIGDDAENYTLSLNGTPTATASITEAVTYYTLNLTANPKNAGTVTGAGNYLSGAEITLTATANEGFAFKNWTNGENVVNQTENFTYTMPATNTNLSANFEPITFTLSYSAGEHGSISGITPQTVNYGTDGTSIEAIPDQGYRFVNWSDSSTDNPRTDKNVTNNISVTANFEAIIFTLSYSAGEHGSISGITPQTVNYGTDGTSIEAIPDQGYRFVNWNDGSTDNPRTDKNVTDNISVTANFEAITVTLSYSAGEHGSISGITPQTVNYGTDGTSVEAIPDQGYRFVNWSDGNTDNPRTDKNVTNNISVTANFEVITYSITFTVTGNGSSIAGASITISNKTLTTDNNGTVLVELPNGTYDYSVSADNYQSVSESVTVNGADTNIPVTLTPTGINNNSIGKISVYPNPFTSNLTIEIENGKVEYYTLINATGKTVKSGILKGTKNELNLLHLNNGIYLLQIYRKNGNKTIRLIKN
ncbi:MAG: LamG-like jellyroll fold domain-containing protein [Bacteroidales bacterium]